MLKRNYPGFSWSEEDNPQAQLEKNQEQMRTEIAQQIKTDVEEHERLYEEEQMHNYAIQEESLETEKQLSRQSESGKLKKLKLVKSLQLKLRFNHIE